MMKSKEDNLIAVESKKFALRIIKLYKLLTEQRREYVMSKQLLRSGTSIGANVKEAIRGQSKADFGAKMSIALKETSESEYWIELLGESEFLTPEEYNSINEDCQRILRILMSIVRTTFKDKHDSQS